MTESFTRRKFLTNSMLAAGALGLSPLLRAEPGAADSIGAGAMIRPIDFSQVTITDTFWRPKLEKVATATLHACIVQTEEKTARIRNFEKVARKKGEAHEGIYFDDSDVYKALEAIAYSLRNRPNTELEKKADEWIDKIAAAQQPDGYLNTYYTLRGLDQRWTDMEKHEDYCAGHLIEAAVAYYRTTGKRRLLDVAIRFADHIDSTFRLPDRHWVSGHEEIELALMKLYHVTGNDRYLQLAEWYLEQRGHGYGKGALWTAGMTPDYCQDAVPVKQQKKITGHAVRAMYLYSGAADVAAVTHDSGYMDAMKTVWQDVVYRNMYLTGGIGSAGQNEGFSEDYDLPNGQAYCETCASVGMVFWNQRMGLLTGESKYFDILERSLYNGALDGLSLSGDRFFYGNPLASNHSMAEGAFSSHLGHAGRSEWFGVACCPSNIARLVASIGGYVYGLSERDVWVNLFIASNTTVELGNDRIGLQLATNYPWDGNVRLTLAPGRPVRCGIRLRLPGWAGSVPAPGDLYRYLDDRPGKVEVLLNGKPVKYREEKGYALVEREWKKGDIIELNLPMDVRLVAARNEVKADRGRIALQRGPLVYCVEGADNNGEAWNFIVTEDAAFAAVPHQVFEERIIALRGQASTLAVTQDGKDVRVQPQALTAIPYYTWANRGNYEMQVWLPTKVDEVRINT